VGVTRRKIELTIDELVLHGLDPSDRAGIREAIERELSRLFAQRGVPPTLAGRGVRAARLEDATEEVQAGSRADAIGAQVARTLYGKLSNSSDLRGGTSDHQGKAPRR
jgi:hypothetical protein